MVICPLNAGECNRLILPKPKTVFVMAPSSEFQTDASRRVLGKIVQVLSDRHYKIIEGSKLIRHGDYFCSICRHTQGCAFGIAMVYDGLPISTISNVYLETGIMQGFGKPVILVVDKRKNLASDYIRHYAVFYNYKKYLSKYEGLLDDIAKLPEEFYVHVGEIALQAQDFEKAAKYYQEAYLINPKPQTLTIIKSISSLLKETQGIPPAYKQRLLDQLSLYK